MNPAEFHQTWFYETQHHFETLELCPATKKTQPHNMAYGVLHLVFLHTCFYVFVLLSNLHTPWRWLRGSTFTASFPSRSLWHSSQLPSAPLFVRLREAKLSYPRDTITRSSPTPWGHTPRVPSSTWAAADTAGGARQGLEEGLPVGSPAE